MDKDIIPFDLERWVYGLPPELYYVEIFIRVLAVFALLLLILRLLGKRSQRNLSPMQNILMISLGIAVGDVMITPTVPLFYSFTVLVLVPGLIALLGYLKLKYKKVHELISADACILIRDGQIIKDAMNANRLRREDLFTMLRVKNIEFLEQVKVAIFEPTGQLSVFQYEEGTYDKKSSLLADFDLK